MRLLKLSLILMTLLFLVSCGGKSLIIDNTIKGGFTFVRSEPAPVEGVMAENVKNTQAAYYQLQGSEQLAQAWVVQYEPGLAASKVATLNREQKEQYGQYWVYGGERNDKLWYSGDYVVMVDTAGHPDAHYIVQKYLEMYPSDLK